MKVRWLRFAIAVAALFSIAVATVVLLQRDHILNYRDPTGSFQQGSYAEPAQSSDGTLRIVTWNTHFAENLDGIIATLKDVSELQVSDLVLLQEVNAEGAEEIAKSLGYNYRYVPTVYSRKRQDEYGIAVLSKWPLKESERISLPNWFPGWIENRYALRAVTAVDGRDVAVYTAHLDLLWMEPQSRFLAQAMARELLPSLLGGDFNTWRPWSVFSLQRDMAEIGLERLSAGSGYTFEFHRFHSTLDHIFGATGLNYSSGVYQQTHASDHYPVWAEILFGPEK